MPPFTMPEQFPIRVSATCPTHARTEASARQHRLVIDEPPSRNGTDLGPSPLETLLCSYLACTNVVANMIAEESGIRVEAMKLGLVGHFDTRGVFGKADIAVPFPRIELKVELVADVSEAQLKALQSALAKRCPVSAILRQAGCEIEEQWTVARPDSA